MVRSYGMVLWLAFCAAAVAQNESAKLKQYIADLDAKDEMRRYEAADAIGALGTKASSAASALKRKLADKSDWARTAYAEALLKVGADSSPVLALLGEQEFRVRYQTTILLIERGLHLEKVLPAVIDLASSAKPGERPLTALAYVREQDLPKAVPILLRQLDRPHREARRETALGFERFAELPQELFPHFEKRLKHEYPDVRAFAAKMLEEFPKHAERSLGLLSKILQGDDVASVRIAAASAIGKLDKKTLVPVKVLREIVERDIDSGRDAQHAVIALGELGPRAVSAAPVIVQQLNIREHWMRGWSLEAIDKIGPGTLPALIKSLDEHQGKAGYRQLRLTIPEAISMFGKSGRAARDVLFEMTKSADTAEVVAALKGLAAIVATDEDVLAKSLKLVESPNNDIRRAAASALGKLAPPKHRPSVMRLSRLLFHHDHKVRLAACESLGAIDPESTDLPPALTELLRSGTSHMKDATCELISQLGPKVASTAPQLAKTLASDEMISAGFGGYSVRGRAAMALEAIGKPAVPELRKALQSKDPEQRGLAAETLGKIGPASKAAIPDLTAMLKDKAKRSWVSGCFGGAHEVRFDAALALGRIGPAAIATLPAIEKMLAGSEHQREMVEAIGGFGPAASRVVPQLLKLNVDDYPSLDVEVTKTLLKIAPDHPQSMARIERFLKKVVALPPAEDNLWPEMTDIIDSIVLLGPKRAAAFVPLLLQLVNDPHKHHERYRGEAAYALAKLDPKTPRWKKIVQDIAEDEIVAMVGMRLRDLE